MGCRHAGLARIMAAGKRRRRAHVATDPRTLEHPIDAMYLLHRALRAEAARVETLAGRLGEMPGQAALTTWGHAWRRATSRLVRV
jgi:hypothetical protein